MRAHCLQHVSFETLGCIEPWLLQNKFEISHTKFYESISLPIPRDIDFLIVLGGPMSVHDEKEYPWLKLEKELIDAVIKLGKPVLGICLGAQLIAYILGSKVYKNQYKEIGWFPISGKLSSDPKLFSFPSYLEVFHWHSETFKLPGQAHLLATSPACANQAFQIGNSVIGLQFHLECTPQSVRGLIRNCSHDIESMPYIQTSSQMLEIPDNWFARANASMNEILSFLIH